jgi:hypothetical protein
VKVLSGGACELSSDVLVVDKDVALVVVDNSALPSLKARRTGTLEADTTQVSSSKGNAMPMRGVCSVVSYNLLFVVGTDGFVVFAEELSSCELEADAVSTSVARAGNFVSTPSKGSAICSPGISTLKDIFAARNEKT